MEAILSYFACKELCGVSGKPLGALESPFWASEKLFSVSLWALGGSLGAHGRQFKDQLVVANRQYAYNGKKWIQPQLCILGACGKPLWAFGRPPLASWRQIHMKRAVWGIWEAPWGIGKAILGIWEVRSHFGFLGNHLGHMALPLLEFGGSIWGPLGAYGRLLGFFERPLTVF